MKKVSPILTIGLGLGLVGLAIMLAGGEGLWSTIGYWVAAVGMVIAILSVILTDASRRKSRTDSSSNGEGSSGTG